MRSDLAPVSIRVDQATEPLESAVTMHQVYGLVKGAGACGIPGEGISCALSTYLQNRFRECGVPTPHRVVVSPKGAGTVLCFMTVGTAEFELELGMAARDFVSAFDDGEFPELIATEGV